MSVRTPGLQARSQEHFYWGQFRYQVGAGVWANGSNLLPGAPGNSLSAVEYAKLEVGDVAVSTDGVTANQGLFVCVDRSVNGAVEWRRADGQTTQTIRDAHRIVVGIVGMTSTPAVNTLLNLLPYDAGVSADFIDQGDGLALSLALATAAGMTGVPDVRIVAGNIDLEGSPVITPLLIPRGVSVIGAGNSLTAISGKFSSGDQGIFSMEKGSSLSGVLLTSGPPPATLGTSLGIIQTALGIAGGDFFLEDIQIFIAGSPLRLTQAAVYAAAPIGPPVTCKIKNVSVTGGGPVPSAPTFGFILDGYSNASILDCSATLTTDGILFAAGNNPPSGNEGLTITNFRGRQIDQTGIGLSTLVGQAIIGASITGGMIDFVAASTVSGQQPITISCDGLADQISVTNLQARWPTGSVGATRIFGNISTNGVGAVIRGLSFMGCGASANGLFSSSLNIGLNLAASDPNSILGMDVGCDFAGAAPLPISAIIAVPFNTVLWTHATPRGLL